MENPFEIRRSKRRTISLSVEDDLHILIKAPLGMSNAEVRAFVEKHQGWIEKHILLQRERQQNAHDFTPAEIKSFIRRAHEIANLGISTYAPLMGVTPTAVKITSAVTRWGSCSGKNSICFSYRIALLPKEASDYIIVHELAHIREKNHGPGFYAEVQKIFPDYKKRIALLKQSQRNLGL